MTSAENIHRQPSCTFQECIIAAAVISSGTGLAIRQFTICARRMPTTIANWFRLTSRPRILAGLISAIYTGDTFELSPIATPPANLQKMKLANE